MSQNKSIINLFKNYLLLERSLSVNTIDAYISDVQKLLSYADDENIKLIHMQKGDLEQFVIDLHLLEISPRSVARIISGIKAFYDYLVIERYRDDNPSELIESPKIGLKLPVFLSLSDIDKILNVIDVSTIEGQRNRAIIETLYSCGLRVSELIGLTFNDLFFSENFIKVKGKGSKQRFVPISASAVKEIEKYLLFRHQQKITRGSEEFVFISKRGTPISRIMIFHFVKKYADLAGIKKNVSPHTFRHSFATHLLEGGANIHAIQLMLGHEKITTTEIYTHLDMDFLRQEILSHHVRVNRNAKK